MRAFFLLATSMVCLLLGMTVPAAQLQQPQPLTPPQPLSPVPEQPQVISPFDVPLPPRDASPPSPVTQPNPVRELPPPGFHHQPTEAEKLERIRQAEAALDKPGPKMPEPGDDELRKLLIARYNAAFAELKSKEAAFNAGTIPFDSLCEAQTRLVQAQFELSGKPADQIAALESQLEFTKQYEQRIKGLALSYSRGGEADKYYQAKFQRLDAEIQLLRAKRKLGLAK